jgi:hypothetical protein
VNALPQKSKNSSELTSRLLDMLRFAAAWSLFLVIFLFVTYPMFGDIHEAGHALACMALCGNVGGLKSWLRGILPFANPPRTNCSIIDFRRAKVDVDSSNHAQSAREIAAIWTSAAISGDSVNAGISDGARESGAKTGLAAGADWI